MPTVLLKDLAQELGLDKSNVRRYVLKQGVEFLKVRTSETRGQQTLALSEEDANFIRERRRAEGFSSPEPVISNGEGWFYVVQLVPELKPGRIKLGFAKDAENRLRAHRTSAPTAEVLKTWPCKRAWEGTVVDCITQKGCKSFSTEVFDCENLDRLIELAEAFFRLMPVL